MANRVDGVHHEGQHPWPQATQHTAQQQLVVRHGHAPSAPPHLQPHGAGSAAVAADPNARGPASGHSGPPMAFHFHNAVNANAVANADAENHVSQVARLRAALVAKVRQSASNPIVAAAMGAIAMALLHNHTPGLKRALCAAASACRCDLSVVRGPCVALRAFDGCSDEQLHLRNALLDHP